MIQMNLLLLERDQVSEMRQDLESLEGQAAGLELGSGTRGCW